MKKDNLYAAISCLFVVIASIIYLIFGEQIYKMQPELYLKVATISYVGCLALGIIFLGLCIINCLKSESPGK